MSMLLEWFHLSERRAVELGLTHEGYLFGVPCWLGDVEDHEYIKAIPKVPLLFVITWIGTSLADLLMRFMPEDVTFVLPFTVGRRIDERIARTFL